MTLCQVCHREAKKGSELCYAKDCWLVWQSYTDVERRQVRGSNVEPWQQYVRYRQRYNPAKITLPKLKFMGD